MKIFLPTLIISFIFLYAFLLFGGILLTKIWFCLLVIAAIIAAIITIAVNQDERIIALEKRIADLEENNLQENNLQEKQN